NVVGSGFLKPEEEYSTFPPKFDIDIPTVGRTVELPMVKFPGKYKAPKSKVTVLPTFEVPSSSSIPEGIRRLERYLIPNPKDSVLGMATRPKETPTENS